MSICPSFHELCTNILTSKSKAALPSLVQKNSYTTVQVQSRTKIRLLYCTLKPLHLLRSRPTPAHFNLPANLPHGQVLPDSKSCHIKVLISLLRQVKLQARFRGSKLKLGTFVALYISYIADDIDILTPISEAHPLFVIILVGPDEIPFGVQKDLLCAQSPYYREYFTKNGGDNQVEFIVKLPDTTVDIFGCFQTFIYTGKVYDKAHGRAIPDYPLLMGVWKLATKLRMAPLRVAVLDTMSERRQETSCIPGTPLLIQAWKETREGSGLRHMLIGWAAEHSPYIAFWS